MCSRTIYFFLFFLLFSEALFSQPAMVWSGNSRFVATLSYEGKRKDTLEIQKRNRVKNRVVNAHFYTINIYQISNQGWVQSLKVGMRRKGDIEEMRFSHDGKTFYLHTRGKHEFWNVKSGFKVKEIRSQDGLVELSRRDNFFLFYNGGRRIKAYDAFTGNFLEEYRVSSRYDLYKMTMSQSDKYFVGQTDERTVLWRIGDERPLKRLRANDYRIDETLDYFTLMRVSDDRLYISVYRLPQATKRTMKKVNFMRVRIGDDRKIDMSRTQLSPTGKYTSVFTGKKENETLSIVQNDNEVVWLSIKKGKGDKELYPYTWLSDRALAIHKDDVSAAIFNTQTQRYVIDLDYSIKYKPNEHLIDIAEWFRERIISPNKRYVALQESHGKDSTILYLKSASIAKEYAFAHNVAFLSFSPNSKRVLVKDLETGKFAFLKSSDVEANLDKNTPMPLYNFSDTLATPSYEDMIAQDAEIPDGYEYNAIKEFRHIKTVPPDELVKLYLKTVEIRDTVTGLQVHLLDKAGNYYYGASEPDYRHIWSNLLLQSPEGKIKEVKEFEVSEYRSSDRLPTAIALILDHSGSMGDHRSLALQQGAAIFTEQKRKNDAIAIIKYDDQVGVEVPLSPTKERLMKDLKMNGMGVYGGGTSILDAIDRGVSILKKADGYGRKSVVILTDGNENSSLLTKGQVLQNTVDNDINIFTVGFGDFVSEEYLKALAFYTQGSYYQIYNTGDFRWIFDDIYKKMRNYYSVRFRTDTTGQYTALLELELDKKRKDSLVTAFDNTPVDFAALDDEENPVEFIAPVRNFDLKEIDLTEFENFSYGHDNYRFEPQENWQYDFSYLNFPDIKFEFNTLSIVEGSEKGVIGVVRFMKQYPETELELHGHTDNVGSAAENLELSQNRANEVKKLLVKKGIKQERIKIKGFGETKPLAKNTDEDGRSQNRRVEFIIKTRQTK